MKLKRKRFLNLWLAFTSATRFNSFFYHFLISSSGKIKLFYITELLESRWLKFFEQRLDLRLGKNVFFFFCSERKFVAGEDKKTSQDERKKKIQNPLETVNFLSSLTFQFLIHEKRNKIFLFIQVN